MMASRKYLFLDLRDCARLLGVTLRELVVAWKTGSTLPDGTDPRSIVEADPDTGEPIWARMKRTKAHHLFGQVVEKLKIDPEKRSRGGGTGGSVTTDEAGGVPQRANPEAGDSPDWIARVLRWSLVGISGVALVGLIRSGALTELGLQLEGPRQDRLPGPEMGPGRV